MPKFNPQTFKQFGEDKIMTVGKLVVNNKNVQVQFTNANGKLVSFNIKESELSASLLALKGKAIAQLHDLEVELEEVGGQPKQIREKGTPFQSSLSNTTQQKPSVGNKKVIPSPSQVRTEATPAGDFHNPYNFVPALPRDKDIFRADPKTGKPKTELGDGKPSGHGSYISDRWSGKISVTLTTVTPLLIPDAADVTKQDPDDPNSHKCYGIRFDPRYLNSEGKLYKPYLPPTSIKGMLRSVYEAITNSRLSILEKHDQRLFYRMSAGDGLSLVPARVEGDQISLMLGTTSDIPTWNGNSQRWSLPNNLMYAAWLPRYRHRLSSISNIGYAGMQHGNHVRVWLEMWQKKTKPDRDGKTKVIFKYWLVRNIVPYQQPLSPQPQVGQASRGHEPVPNQPMIETDGYVCISNRNIESKHDERVFFNYQNPAQHSEEVSKHQTDWKYLIANYQEIHEGQTRENNLDWSRHVLAGSNNLTDGELCYAYVEKDKHGYKIRELYPVMISRAIYDSSPIDLLPQGLQPAEKLCELSPADRVFGWVNQDGNGSYKGQLRVHSVKCESDDAIKDDFGNDGLPLAILGQPKPQQSRFYAASSDQGEPLEDGCDKSEGYQEDGGLRGRKVYPHHQLPNPQEYWNPTQASDRVGDRHYKEYLSVDGTGSTQNRSIKGWVKPEKKFSFEIDVINLSDVELGALLWLLKLEPDCFHRLGGGKPLGFGSVRLEISDTDLRTGNQWKEFYKSLLVVDTQKPNQTKALNTVEIFHEAIEAAYSKKFDQVSFIAAFLKSAQGFSNPIHYPRTTQAPDANIESFKWFVDNESQPKGMKLSLQSLAKDNGLLLQPKKP